MSRRIPDWSGPGTSFTITGAASFVDTLTLFLWRPLPTGALKHLRQHYGRRMQYTRQPVRPQRRVFRAFLTLQQPDAATLSYLAGLQKGTFAVHAVHIPIDFLCADRHQALLATEFLTVNLAQKWRRQNHHIQLKINTRYWKRDGKAPRNIALYSDRLSKPTSVPCAHLELRFNGAAACKRAKLNDLNTLIDGIDALELLQHQAAIAVVNAANIERTAEMMARRTVRRRPGSRNVAQLKDRAQTLLERCLATEDGSTYAAARAREELWGRRPKLRRRLLTVLGWEDFTPTPQWHAWQCAGAGGGGGKTNHTYHSTDNQLIQISKNKPLALSRLLAPLTPRTNTPTNTPNTRSMPATQQENRERLRPRE